MRLEAFSEAAVRIRSLESFGDGVGVLLVGRSPFGWERPAPKRRVDLGNHRATGRSLPAVERPEMHAVANVLPDIAQPRDACVRGLRYRPPHVELEHGLGGACPQFGDPRQRGLPERATPFPVLPSRTKSTLMFSSVGQCRWKSSRNDGQSNGNPCV